MQQPFTSKPISREPGDLTRLSKQRTLQHYQAQAAEAAALTPRPLRERYSHSGGISSCDAYLCTSRWGGGADHGRYHVFLLGAPRAWELGFGVSLQCVVDDFGDLVRVH